MKIVVFCDGTWRSRTTLRSTHVAELKDALLNDATKGQVVAYFPGVGTFDRYDSPLRKFLTKYGGGIFGWGLDVKVKQAYDFIAQAYGADDEIYLFGYSRGAYTARSVAGMIRKTGIIENPTPARVNQAFALYRKPGIWNTPDRTHIQKERLALSPEFATSDDDLKFRKTQDAEDRSELVNIAYIGVWDTVGARGLPPAILGPLAVLWNARYRFHDMRLSRLVKKARHAVATDERRVFYPPALWDNLHKLNGEAEGDERAFQQLWFCGVHGTIGGDIPEHKPLSSFPLEWVFEGSNLALKPGQSVPSVAGDALKTVTGLDKRGLFQRARRGPFRREDVHASTENRVQNRKDYRPFPLARLFGF